MDENMRKELGKLQMMEQNLQTFLVSKQTASNQLNEVESALAAVSDSTNAYKIIGNIMVKRTPDTVQEELEQKKDQISAHIASIESQEKKIKEKMEDLQSTLIKKTKGVSKDE